MPTWNYWHRIEYRRELAKGRCVHEYTEVVEDQGWTLTHIRVPREEWFAYYTRGCAEDFRAVAAVGNSTASNRTPGKFIAIMAAMSQRDFIGITPNRYTSSSGQWSAYATSTPLIAPDAPMTVECWANSRCAIPPPIPHHR